LPTIRYIIACRAISGKLLFYNENLYI